MSAESEHWFDRLTTPHTRRQGFKAALAGAAVALPLGRFAPVASALPDCFRGCVWTVHQRYGNDSIRCNGGYFVGTTLFGFDPVLAIPARLFYGNLKRECLDKSLSAAQHGYDKCQQPACGGDFDPYAPGGPCDGCIDSCNPCPDVDSGYICCIYPVGDCHGDCCPSHPGSGCP